MSCLVAVLGVAKGHAMLGQPSSNDELCLTAPVFASITSDALSAKTTPIDPTELPLGHL